MYQEEEMIESTTKFELHCPDCGENWLHGWTWAEMKTFLGSGVNRLGVAITGAKCIKCKHKYTVPTILALLK